MSMTLEAKKRRGETSVDPASGGRAVGCYVLIQTAPGMVQQVEHAVARLGGVTTAEVVTGPWDVIAWVECADVYAVVQAIQAVDGVTRSLASPVVHRRRESRPIPPVRPDPPTR